MDPVYSLAGLIKRQKIYQAELVDELEKDANKMSLLYNNILEGNIRNDNDAYKILYKGKQKKESLKRLKNRLYHRLINSVFFLDVSGSKYSDVFEAAQTCYKYYAAVKLLLGNRQRNVAIDLAKKTFSQSQKYEFTDLNYLLSATLRNYYLLYEHNPSKFKKYNNLKQYYLEALEAEDLIEELQGMAAMKLSNSSSGLPEEELFEFEKKIPAIEELQKKIHTSKFNLLSTLFLVSISLEKKDYAEIIKVVENGFKKYHEIGIPSTPTEFLFNSRIALASFLLKNYEKSEMLYNANNNILTKGEQNWFSNYNQLFSLMIIQGRYNDAYEIICKIINHKNFETTHPVLVQLWKIKEAYIHFLVENKKIDPSLSSEKDLRKFRLNRFLNDVPTYSKDKRGVNISILIIQMILLVQNKNYDQVIDRLDALNMYCHRYLRNDNSFRSNCFIKMLMKLPDADYHPIRWARYVKKLRERLDEHPFELSYHNLDLEVIPFETLYELVIEMLEQQKGIGQ